MMGTDLSVRRGETSFSDELRERGVKPQSTDGFRPRLVFGTHDTNLISKICGHARGIRMPPAAYEFHMLYGIQRGEQLRLSRAEETVRVLVAYGSYWFPWYMRRLAERPANLWFVVKSVFAQ